MKLPNAENAIIPPDKLTDYLLSQTHLIGRWKAKFFISIGFNETRIDELEEALFGGEVRRMIRELDIVALRRDFDAYGLKQGDIGAVVHNYGKEGFEVEFMTAAGETIAVLTLKKSDVRGLRGREILHVRDVSQPVYA